MNHKSTRLLTCTGIGAALLWSASASAQEKNDLESSPLVGKLATCTAITDDAERLACFDKEVGAFVGAANEGDVKVVEREEINKARKKLFGYSVPDAGIFKANSKEEKEQAKRLTSTITKVRQVSSKEWHIWIEEGDARWRLKNNSIRFKAPKVGDTVEFKPATMGTYWIRVNGRKGVRGQRIG